ncbi:hypothetical protein M0R45_008795 [Rubus argutus]|uniref:DUF4218 domain-containing protein n=1 Tax=Rubus argutus TaxID=59490 RepID=A0AAW1Y2S2_RUBAR
MFKDACFEDDDVQESTDRRHVPDYENLLEEAELPIYTGSTWTKMSAIVACYKFKARHSLSNTGGKKKKGDNRKKKSGVRKRKRDALSSCDDDSEDDGDDPMKLTIRWKKKSIFFELPYWQHLLLSHNLDMMHIEKNIFHLVQEVLIGGPVHLRWMFPFERYVSVLNHYVKNRSNPEGCIAENYLTKEITRFCSGYIQQAADIGVQYKRNEVDEDETILEGQPFGRKRTRPMTSSMLEIAHRYVLTNTIELDPRKEIHKHELKLKDGRLAKNESLLEKKHWNTLVIGCQTELELAIVVICQVQQGGLLTSKKGGKKGKNQQKRKQAAATQTTASTRQEESNPPIRMSDGDSNSPSKLQPTPTHNSPSRFSSFLGATSKDFVPVTINKWKDLSATYTQQIWEHITQHYVVHELYKRNIFRRMMKLWRDHKSLLLKDVMKQAEEVGLPRAAALLKPDNVDSMDEWLAFLKSKTTAEFREKSERFKSMRGRRTLLHRTSRKSFACLEEELKQQNESHDMISRSDVWLCAYEAKKKKGSNEEVEDLEIVKQVKKYKEEEEVASQPCSIKNDDVAKVLGPDRRGRVRGYGFGVLPSKVDFQSHVSSKVTILENALAAQGQVVDQLKEMCDRTEKAKENPSVVAATSNSDMAHSKHNDANVKSFNNSRGNGNLIQQSFNGNEQYSGHGRPTKTQKADLGKQVCLLSWYDKEELVVATAALYCPTSEFSKLDASIGSVIAWLIKYIKMN